MWNRMPLWRMREALDRGETSAAELVEAHLAEIEKTNPRVNAFIEIYADEARQRAREPLEGPLAGVPVTVKDSFDLAGRVTWCGSLLRRQERAARDSNAAVRLKAARRRHCHRQDFHAGVSTTTRRTTGSSGAHATRWIRRRRRAARAAARRRRSPPA
jgi:hypothetical protein